MSVTDTMLYEITFLSPGPPVKVVACDHDTSMCNHGAIIPGCSNNNDDKEGGKWEILEEKN